ncbi:MAG: GAF and ANTAR domain-containing protein [Acidimicrobiales bacterium]
MPDTQDATAELANSISQVAQTLFSAGSTEATLQTIVDLAITTIEGCDFAGIFTVAGDDEVTTPVHTHPVVVEIDSFQRVAGEGPCLDAIAQGSTFYAHDLADDPRWPAFGPRAAAAGVRCMLVLHLRANGTLGALNLCARYPGAFGATDRAKGVIFATLAGLALGGAAAHEAEDRRIDSLHRALATREIIGQAQGMLMERDRITSDQAFDILLRASRYLDVKLRKVAEELIDTGDSPTTGPTRPS